MTAKRKNALGRGLGALLDDSLRSNDRPEAPKVSSVASIHEIPTESIETNPFQPRTHFDREALLELSDSIKTQGIIQPITVRKLTADTYQLIAGERRLQAARIAGIPRIPAYVRTANDQQMLEMALIENIQRENLNAVEIALSYQRLQSECELNLEELGERVGKNRATVNNYLRLLKLPPDIQAAIRDKKISMGHARALVTVENIDSQLEIFKKIIAQDLSVRKVEELVRSYQKEKNSDQPAQPEPNQEITRLQHKLTSHFGTRVLIRSDGNKGDIKIPFVSVDDLNRILEILQL